MAMNCMQCQFACHNPCDCWFSGMKTGACAAFELKILTRNNCSCCPGKCDSSSSNHSLQNWAWDTRTRQETITRVELKKRYLTAEKENTETEDVCNAIGNEISRDIGILLGLLREMVDDCKEVTEMSSLPNVNLKSFIQVFVDFLSFIFHSHLSKLFRLHRK